MKKQIKLICTVLALACFTACSLDEYNPSGSREETVFTLPEGAEAGINGVYSYMRSLWGRDVGHYLLEAGTDLWTGGSDNPKPNLTNYSNLSATEPYFDTNLWLASYSAINQANLLLENLDVAFGETDHRRIREAEVRFLRAWQWWVLTECFGDIYFTTEPLRDNTTEHSRTPQERVYEEIFKDVEFAILNLKETNTNYGRVTKPVAEAFMARLCLTRGRNAEAITFAKSVIDNYSFSLVDDYSQLWGVANEKNSEVIWAVNHHETPSLNGYEVLLHKMYNMHYQNLEGMTLSVEYADALSRLMPTYHLLSLYDQENDARFAGSFRSEWNCNNNPPKWTEEDQRVNPAVTPGEDRYSRGDLAVKLVFGELQGSEKFPMVPYLTYDIDDLYDRVTKKPNSRVAHFVLTKHEDEKVTTYNQTNTQKDAFLIRLAEMYLIIAEADMKLNGPTGEDAVKYFNLLRAKRVAPGGDVNRMLVNSVPDIDFILDERAREFAGEQMRWLDLKRTGKLVERVRAYNPDASDYIKEVHVLRPIPQSQIDAVTNKEKFPQNDGY